MPGQVIKVLIKEKDQEEPKVEVTVPLKLAKWALKLLPVAESKIREETDIDVEALRALLEEGFDELSELGEVDLVKVNDGNSSIKISIEVD